MLKSNYKIITSDSKYIMIINNTFLTTSGNYIDTYKSQILISFIMTPKNNHNYNLLDLFLKVNKVYF